MGGLHFKEVALVHCFADQLMHVIGLIGIGRDQHVQAFLDPVPRIRSRALGHFLLVGQGKKIDKIARSQQRLNVVFKRSEEHTSELQSLMRISYAVFCLKTKTKIQPLKKTLTEIYIKK